MITVMYIQKKTTAVELIKGVEPKVVVVAVELVSDAEEVSNTIVDESVVVSLLIIGEVVVLSVQTSEVRSEVMPPEEEMVDGSVVLEKISDVESVKTNKVVSSVEESEIELESVESEKEDMSADRGIVGTEKTEVEKTTANKTITTLLENIFRV
uniref:Uncharacterized protein n=1 Tax=Panagrolaimus sp. ES5 TaxID=591445 RepID=A0AC34GUG2_9BILA